MMADGEKTERELLIEEFLGWLNAMEDIEELRVSMSSEEFLSKVSNENLRVLINSKKELYKAHQELDNLLKRRK